MAYDPPKILSSRFCDLAFIEYDDRWNNIKIKQWNCGTILRGKNFRFTKQISGLKQAARDNDRITYKTTSQMPSDYKFRRKDKSKYIDSISNAFTDSFWFIGALIYHPGLLSFIAQAPNNYHLPELKLFTHFFVKKKNDITDIGFFSKEALAIDSGIYGDNYINSVKTHFNWTGNPQSGIVNSIFKGSLTKTLTQFTNEVIGLKTNKHFNPNNVVNQFNTDDKIIAEMGIPFLIAGYYDGTNIDLYPNIPVYQFLLKDIAAYQNDQDRLARIEAARLARERALIASVVAINSEEAAARRAIEAARLEAARLEAARRAIEEAAREAANNKAVVASFVAINSEQAAARLREAEEEQQRLAIELEERQRLAREAANNKAVVASIVAINSEQAAARVAREAARLEAARIEAARLEAEQRAREEELAKQKKKQNEIAASIISIISEAKINATRLAQEAEKKRQADILIEKKRQEDEEAEKKRQADIDAEKKRQADIDAEKKRQADIDAEKKRLAEIEEEKKRQAEIEEEKKRQADILIEKKRQEEEEEAEKKRQADILIEKKRQEEEEAEKKRQADILIEKKRQDEEEAEKKRQADILIEKKRQEEEEVENKRIAQEVENKRLAEVEAAKKANAEASFYLYYIIFGNKSIENKTQIRNNETQIRNNETQIRNNETQIELLDSSINILNEQLNSFRTQYTEYENEDKNVDVELKSARDNLASLNARLKFIEENFRTIQDSSMKKINLKKEIDNAEDKIGGILNRKKKTNGIVNSSDNVIKELKKKINYIQREMTTLSNNSEELKNTNGNLTQENIKLNIDNAKESNKIKAQIIEKLKTGIDKINTVGNNVKIEPGQNASFITGLFEAYLPNININNLTESQLGNALYNLLPQAVVPNLSASKNTQKNPIQKVVRPNT